MLSYILKRAVVLGQPMAVSIEPINVCNLKCPECPTGLGQITRPKGMVETTQFQTMLEKLPKETWHVNLYFQGEPFMHPDFFKLVQLSKQKGLVTETSTNAHYLNKEQAKKTIDSGLDHLIVSMDGVSQKVYEQYRVGGRLIKVLEGIDNLVEAKRNAHSKKPIITLQFLAFSFNEDEIDAFRKKAMTLGVDQVQIKTAQIYNVEDKKHLLPKADHLSRYRLQKDGSVLLKGSLKNRCWKHWHSSVITWNGDVVPCCFDKDASHQLGNIMKNPLSKIWSDKPYNGFRNAVLKRQAFIEICKNCPISRNN